MMPSMMPSTALAPGIPLGYSTYLHKGLGRHLFLLMASLASMWLPLTSACISRRVTEYLTLPPFLHSSFIEKTASQLDFTTHLLGATSSLVSSTL